MPVISVSLPGDDLDAFDRLVDHMDYDSRSGAVRDALYHFTQAHRHDLPNEGDVGLVLTLVYGADHGQDDVQTVIHDHGDLVRTTLHQHLDDRCVDLLVLHGDAEPVHDVVDRLTSIRDVRVNITPLDPDY